MADSSTLTEAQGRRRRIRLYKRIIVCLLLLLIILPTIFCIILFVKVGRLQSRLDTLMIMRMAESDGNTDNHDIDVADADMLFESAAITGEIEPSSEPLSNACEETVSVAEATGEDDAIETPGLSAKEFESRVSPGEVFYGNYSESMIEPALKEGRKVVYLTFDDGPSNNTSAILDILDEYGVKATFFMIGNEQQSFDDDYSRIVSEGHSLGMHSFSHKYNEIYKSVSDFEKDFNSICDFIEEKVGYVPRLYRFPGGSSNLVSFVPMTEFIDFLSEKNFRYFDWNASAKDSEGKILSAETIVENIMIDVNRKDVSVVLMHDADHLNTTVEALPILIEKLISMDAVILPITENTVPVQHITK